MTPVFVYSLNSMSIVLFCYFICLLTFHQTAITLRQIVYRTIPDRLSPPRFKRSLVWRWTSRLKCEEVWAIEYIFF